MTLIQYFKVYREEKLAYDVLSHTYFLIYILRIALAIFEGTPPQRWEGVLILT